MGITKLRANSQVKTGTIDSPAIGNYALLPIDVAPNSFDGSMFKNGSIGLEKLAGAIDGGGVTGPTGATAGTIIDGGGVIG